MVTRARIKPKKWYESKTIWIAVLVVITAICDYILLNPAILGSGIDPDTRIQLLHVVNLITLVAGMIIGFLRWGATNQPIEGSPADKPVIVKERVTEE